MVESNIYISKDFISQQFKASALNQFWPDRAINKIQLTISPDDLHLLEEETIEAIKNHDWEANKKFFYITQINQQNETTNQGKQLQIICNVDQKMIDFKCSILSLKVKKEKKISIDQELNPNQVYWQLQQTSRDPYYYQNLTDQYDIDLPVVSSIVFIFKEKSSHQLKANIWQATNKELREYLWVKNQQQREFDQIPDGFEQINRQEDNNWNRIHRQYSSSRTQDFSLMDRVFESLIK